MIIGNELKVSALVIIGVLVLSLPAWAGVPAGEGSGTLQGILTRITTGTDGSDQQNSALSGEYLAWEDNRNGDWDIYVFSFLNGTVDQVTNDSADQLSPVLSASLLAWTDYRNGNADIYLRNLTSGEEVRLTSNASDQDFPDIDGDRVAWVDYRDGNSQLYLYNITTGVETAVTADPWLHVTPSIWDDWLTWVDYRNGDPDIFLYRISTGNETRVTNSSGQYRAPSVDGDYVVWEDDSESLPVLRLFSIETGNTTTINPGISDGMPTDPEVGDGLIAWQDNLGTGYPNIFLYEIATSRTTQVTNESFSNQAPTIWGNRVSWTVTQDRGADINLFTIGASGTCPVAGFTCNSSIGSLPLTVQFNDTSSGTPVHWTWDFGDGGTSTDQHPVHTYLHNGTYSVSLTIDTPACRDYLLRQHIVSIGGVPIPWFTADPESGPAALTVQFTDISGGSPDTWTWDFGDNATASEQHPVHRYDVPGSYNVTLTAGNIFGNNTVTYQGFITVMAGTTHEVSVEMPGVTVSVNGSRQVVTCNTTLANCTFDPGNNTVLAISGPEGCTLEKMILRSDEGSGFAREGNDTLAGTLTGLNLRSAPLSMTGFSAQTGKNCQIWFGLDLPVYPAAGKITVTGWEGVTPADEQKLHEAVDPSPSFAGITRVAYTTRFDTGEIGETGPARVVMSINTSWVRENSQQWLVPTDIDTNPTGAGCTVDGVYAGFTPLTTPLTPGLHSIIFTMSGYGSYNESINVTADSIRVIRIGDDGVAGILNTTLIASDPATGLDYYEAYSPDGLSTFTLAGLNRHGNPFQLFTLFYSTHYSDTGSSSGGGGGGGGVGGSSGSSLSASLTPPSNAADNTPAPTPVDTPAHDQGLDSAVTAAPGTIQDEPRVERASDADQQNAQMSATGSDNVQGMDGGLSGLVDWIGSVLVGRFIFIFAAVAITVASVIVIWKRGQFDRD